MRSRTLWGAVWRRWTSVYGLTAKLSWLAGVERANSLHPLQVRSLWPSLYRPDAPLIFLLTCHMNWFSEMDKKRWLFAAGKRGRGIVSCYGSKSLDQFGCWQTTPHKAESYEIVGGGNGKNKQGAPAVLQKNMCVLKNRETLCNFTPSVLIFAI